MVRILAMLAVALGLAACAPGDPAEEDTLVPMGDFRLGHNVVVTPNIVKGPLSREADEGSWEEVLKDEIDRRFGRYEGDKLYHLGISVEAYVLAAPGVPLVFSPKSILIVKATAWDDAAGAKLNEEPKQITVLESISGETLVGSGLTQKKEKQQRNLARNAARAIQRWLLENPEWFGIDEAAAEEAKAQIPDATVDTAKLEAQSVPDCVPSETVTCPEPPAN